MAVTYKFTTIFSGPSHGAQEAWFFQQTSADLTLAMKLVDPIVRARQALLGREWSIKAWKCSQMLDDAGKKVVRRSRLHKDFLVGDPGQGAAESNVSLQVLFQTADGVNQKFLDLVGAWDGIFQDGDAYNNDFAGWRTAFNTWTKSLNKANMGWMAVDAKQTAKVTGYTFDPATGFTTYELAPVVVGPPASGITWPELGVPTRVAVEFPIIRNPLDGVQIVIPNLTALVGPPGLAPITAKPRPAEPFTVQGKMVYDTFKFVQWNIAGGQPIPGFVEPQNPMTRKRGRPLLASRGARPKTVRW
jgi:hypothetical protein